MTILEHPSSAQSRLLHDRSRLDVSVSGDSSNGSKKSLDGPSDCQQNAVRTAQSNVKTNHCVSGPVTPNPNNSQKSSAQHLQSSQLVQGKRLNREQPSGSASMAIDAVHRIPKNHAAKIDNSSRDDSAVAERESENNETRCFLLWIDGVGVWQLLMGNHFVIGAPASKGPEADLAIQANVRKQHASLFSERDEWLLDPLADTFIGNQRVAKKAHLRSGDQIRLGESVELGFRLPSPLSHSAVLDFESGHRPLQSVDGVILLTDHCIVGPRRDQHIYCSTWQHSFVLFRRESKLLCRSSGDFQFNGKDVDDVCEIAEDSMIESEHCRFRIEVIR